MRYSMRLGIDWGGTKLEVIAINDDGEVLLRERVPTPRDYKSSIAAVSKLISDAESSLDREGTVGIGIPGTLSRATGLVKNANSVWLNGMPLKEDMEAVLDREIRITNDANCFAVSEATDGAGAGHGVVAGVIIGTGCGCGIAIDGKAHVGRNGIGGEFGHTPLPWMKPDEYPGELCWCGRRSCLETWISGTGFQRDYQRRSGEKELRPGSEILQMNTVHVTESLNAYIDRLARGLSALVNIVDPDIIVLGGGMSNVQAIYENVTEHMKPYVFSDMFDTPIVAAKHGDSSGVRGAAWLW